jgi:hypothetical protein
MGPPRHEQPARSLEVLYTRASLTQPEDSLRNVIEGLRDFLRLQFRPNGEHAEFGGRKMRGGH